MSIADRAYVNRSWSFDVHVAHIHYIIRLSHYSTAVLRPSFFLSASQGRCLTIGSTMPHKIGVREMASHISGGKTWQYKEALPVNCVLHCWLLCDRHVMNKAHCLTVQIRYMKVVASAAQPAQCHHVSLQSVYTTKLLCSVHICSTFLTELFLY